MPKRQPPLQSKPIPRPVQPPTASSGTATRAGSPARPGKPQRQGQLAQQAGNAASAQINNQNYQDASQYIHNASNASDFDGVNDYLSDVGSKAGASSFDEPLSLLRQFIGGADGGPGVGAASGNSRRVSPAEMQAAVARDQAMVANGGHAGGGAVPDTVGDSDSFFARHVRDLFDPSRLDPANDPTMQPYLRAMEEESARAFAQNKSLLDARAEGSGRFGGGMYQNMQGLAAGENARALQGQLASTLFGSRQQAIQRQMEGLGMTNQRDLSAMQDATQRYGIDQSASASRAGSAGNEAAQARQQQLQAIGMLMGHQQFGLGMEQQVGQNLQQNQLGAINSIPGLEGANQGYMQVMNQSNQTLQQPRLAQIGNAPAMANLHWQQQMYNSPESQMQRYLGMIGQVAGLGGAQWGQGPPPGMMPLGPSVGGAAAQGAVGGYFAGSGMGGG